MGIYIGNENNKGTKIFSLVGKINNTGLVESPMGTPLRKIIYELGGGIPGGKNLKPSRPVVLRVAVCPKVTWMLPLILIT